MTNNVKELLKELKISISNLVVNSDKKSEDTDAAVKVNECISNILVEVSNVKERKEE